MKLPDNLQKIIDDVAQREGGMYQGKDGTLRQRPRLMPDPMAIIAGIETAQQLQAMRFEPLRFVVPGLLTASCVMLAGRPKSCKSWMALDIGIAVSRDGYCLGERKCVGGDVLYLALEDSRRRLQHRMDKILGLGPWPERFTYRTQWPRIDEGGVEVLDLWCELHPDRRLIVIDVFAALRAPQNGKDIYGDDYRAIAELQRLSSRREVAILIVHHTRKGSADDAVEEISGTLGIAGALDAFLVLRREGSQATLVGRSREIEDIDLALMWQREACRWTVLGNAGEVRQHTQCGRITAALASKPDGLSIGDIMIAADLVDRHVVHQVLYRMVKEGTVVRQNRGLYSLQDGTKPQQSNVVEFPVE